MKYDKSFGVPEHLIREEPYTYDEYVNLPEDGNRYELAGGILQLMSPSPGTKHQKILIQLTNHFLQHCKPAGEFYFAPLDVILSPYYVRQPDFVFVTHDRSQIVTERGIEGVPDLVAEILSPSTAMKDKTEKREEYARFGVKEYWIIDPVYELLEQFVLSGEQFSLRHIYKREETVQSEIASCVQLSINDLFGLQN